jgi:hypothetical protein
MNLTRNSGIFVGRKVVGLTVAAQMVVFIDNTGALDCICIVKALMAQCSGLMTTFTAQNLGKLCSLHGTEIQWLFLKSNEESIY